MKKSALLFALLLCMIISLCACTGNGQSGSVSGEGASESVSAVSDEASEEPSDSSVNGAPEQSLAQSSIPEREKTDSAKESEGSESIPQDSFKGADASDNDIAQSSADISDIFSDEAYSSEKLPDELRRISKTKLRFTSSVLSLSATFSDEFCVLNRDYTPKYGIYLQNKAGTATLLAESVEDTTLTYRQMTEYLKSRYPDARIYTTDQKDVVCKTTATDQNGNEICVFERIKMQNGGYNVIAVCCRPEDKTVFEKLFNETSFS